MNMNVDVSFPYRRRHDSKVATSDQVARERQRRCYAYPRLRLVGRSDLSTYPAVRWKMRWVQIMHRRDGQPGQSARHCPRANQSNQTSILLDETRTENQGSMAAVSWPDGRCVTNIRLKVHVEPQSRRYPGSKSWPRTL